MVLLPHKSQEHVGKALDFIEMLCGREPFRLHFKNILTDRGSEFLDPRMIETGIEGDKRCSVYYCDPMKSGQKGAAEKNHVELRKILPKGASLDTLTAWELSHICSHVNSYARPALGGVSPFTLASQVLPKDLLDGLGITIVEPDEVTMRPSLLKEHGLRQ
jgi:IS30 family transposase